MKVIKGIKNVCVYFIAINDVFDDHNYAHAVNSNINRNRFVVKYNTENKKRKYSLYYNKKHNVDFEYTK